MAPVVVCILFTSLLQFCVESQQEVLIEESLMIESIHAPTGGVVELPCDVVPALPEDRMTVVIWYKQGHDSAIYSLETREGVMSHWSDPTTLGVRASFRSDSKPAVLVLTKLRPEDSGQYRCRVDFIKSPTKNTRLNLTLTSPLLIPPERLIILNHEGNEIQDGMLGPYDEGTEVNLTCVAVGGRPPARVSWWKSHALLANSEARATVALKLQRADYGTEVTCQAVTDPAISPVSENVSIDINLRPLWVRLQGGKRPLVAGQATELVCLVVGARPKPNISWWKGGTRMKTFRESSSLDGNMTSSFLTFVPSIEDAGRVMSCRAVQPTLAYSMDEDGFLMEIQHRPVVKLELGADLNATNVVEGSDVYLDCRVRANPAHTIVYFSHNGVTVKAGPGVLLVNQSLVLQKVSRKAAGSYVCTAKNSLGEGSSDRLLLDVKYSPACQSIAPRVFRAARGEAVDIECELDANPREPMAYHWWFNSSAHSKHELTTSTSMHTPHINQGSLLYLVNTSADYGWVQCTGSNSIGRQSKPCLFHILPADKPSTPKACEITNVTYDSLTLNCTPGHDGGIRQSFMLEISEMGSGVLLRNVSNEEPEFQVSELSSTNPLAVAVRAYNKKGSSEPYTLISTLLKYPERHTAQVPVKVELTPRLMIVLGVVGVYAGLTTISAIDFCRRTCSRRKRQSNMEKTHRQRDEASNMPLTSAKDTESVDSLGNMEKTHRQRDEASNMPLTSAKDTESVDSLGNMEKTHRQRDEASNMPLTSAKDTESVDSLDKNPDIIPLDGKVSDSCSNKYSATDYSSIRPLISKTPGLDSIPPNCERFYDHNIDRCNQFMTPTLDYRMLTQPPNLKVQMGPSMGPNLGPSIQSIGSMSSLSHPASECHRQCDKAYEDWLKFKNALPLNTSGLLPAEQLMPPELYAAPPPALYSNRNPLNLAQMPELEPRFVIEPRLAAPRSCSNTPSVRFDPETSCVYFNKSMLDQHTAAFQI